PCRDGSRGAPVAGQAAQADVGDPALGVQVRLERHRAAGGQPIRAAAVVAVDRLDQASRFEAGERLVEGARREAHPGERLDVLGERIPVFSAVGETGQDQRGRPRVPPESRERLALARFAGLLLRHAIHFISAPDLSEADLSAPGQDRPPRVVPSPGPDAQHVYTEVFRAGTPASHRAGGAGQPARRFARWKEERAVTERYDVIIVGSGAGGGTLAHALAGSGKKILLLERGDFLPRETDNWDARAVFAEGRYISKDTWFDSGGKPFQPQVHYFVGGATKLYGAALYRLRPADFGELRHVDGISPALPLSYHH